MVNNVWGEESMALLWKKSRCFHPNSVRLLPSCGITFLCKRELCVSSRYLIQWHRLFVINKSGSTALYSHKIQRAWNHKEKSCSILLKPLGLREHLTVKSMFGFHHLNNSHCIIMQIQSNRWICMLVYPCSWILTRYQ